MAGDRSCIRCAGHYGPVRQTDGRMHARTAAARRTGKRKGPIQMDLAKMASDTRTSLGLIIAATLAAFGLSLRNGFVWDDWELVVGNEVYRTFDLRALLAGQANTLEYLPVRDLSFALDAFLWGSRPFGYHLTNLLLYCAGIAALFTLMRRLAGLIGLAEVTTVAFWTTMVFALHPVHAEVVNFVTARNTLLAGLFLFLSLAVLVRGIEHGDRLRIAASLGFFALAVFSKAIALFAPAFVLVLFLVLPGQRVPRRTSIAVTAAFSGVALAAAWVHVRNAATSGVMNDELLRFGTGSLWLVLAKAVQVPLFYLRLTGAPSPLSVDYSVPFLEGAVGLRASVSLLLVVLMLTSAWLLRKRAPLITLGAAWFFFSLVPVMNLFPTHPMVADRYAFFALAGLGMVVAHVVSGRERWFVPLAAGLCILWGGMSIARTLDWRSDETLWRAAIDANAGASRVPLGQALWKQDRYEEALEQFREERSRRGSYHASLYEGALLAQGGRYDESILAYRRAMAEGGDAYREVQVALASSYEQKKEFRLALDHYLRAADAGSIDVNGRYAAAAEKGIERMRERLSGPLRELTRRADGPGRRDPGTLARLGLEYHSLGRYAEAASMCVRSLELDPARWEVWYNLGLAQMRLRRYDRAVGSFERALTIHEDPNILNNLGVASMRMGDRARAESAYQRALAKDPAFFYAAFNLARVAFIAGDGDQARERFRRAASIVPGNEALQHRIDQYLHALGAP